MANGFFSSFDTETVEKFEDGGLDFSGFEKLKNGFDGMAFSLVGGQEGLSGFWGWDQAKGGVGNHSEHAFGTDPEVSKIVAGGEFFEVAAQFDVFASGEIALEGDHVISGYAVLHASQPAGIAGDVSADGAPLEGGGIGGIHASKFEGGLLDLAGDGSCLGMAEVGKWIDGKLVEPGQVEYPTAVPWCGGSGQGRCRPTGGNGDVEFVGQFQNRCYLRGFGWSYNSMGWEGYLQPVMAMGLQVFLGSGGLLREMLQEKVGRFVELCFGWAGGNWRRHCRGVTNRSLTIDQVPDPLSISEFWDRRFDGD